MNRNCFNPKHLRQTLGCLKQNNIQTTLDPIGRF